MKIRNVKLDPRPRTAQQNHKIIQSALKLLRAPSSSAWLTAQKDCADILTTHKQTTLISRLFSQQEILVRTLIIESQAIILSHISSSIERAQIQAAHFVPQLAIEDTTNALKPVEAKAVVSSLTPPPHLPPQPLPEKEGEGDDDDQSMIYGQPQPPTQVPPEPSPVDAPPSPMSPTVAPQTLRRLVRVADKVDVNLDLVDNTEAIPSSSLEELLKDEEASMVAEERREEQQQLDGEYDNDVYSRERESVFTQTYQSQADKPKRRLPHTMLPIRPAKDAKERSLRGITLAKRSSMKRDQRQMIAQEDDLLGKNVKEMPAPALKRPKRTLYITDEPSAPDDTPMREAKSVLKAQQDHDLVMSITSFPTATTGVDAATTAAAAAAAMTAVGKRGAAKGGRSLLRGRAMQEEEEVEAVNAIEFSAGNADNDGQPPPTSHIHAKRTGTATSKFQAFQEQARMAVSAAAARYVPPPPPSTASKGVLKKGPSFASGYNPKTPIEKASAAQARTTANATSTNRAPKAVVSAQQPQRTSAPLGDAAAAAAPPPPPRTMSLSKSKRAWPGGGGGMGHLPSLVSRAFSAKDARPLFEALRGDPRTPMSPLAPSSAAPPRFKPGYNAANTPAPPPVPVRMADGRYAIVAGPVAEILSGTTASVTAGGGGDAAGVRGVGTLASVSRSSIEAQEPQPENLDGQDMIIDSASTAVPAEVDEEESLIDSGVIEAALLLDGGIQWEEDGGRGGTGQGGRGGGEDLGRLSIPNNPGRSTAVAAAGLAWMMGADDDYLSAGGASLQQIPAELLAAIHEDHVSGRASLQQVEDVPQEDEFSPDVVAVSGKLNDSDFMSESEGNNNYDGDFPEEGADSMPPFRIQVDPGDEDVEPSPLHVVAKQQIASKLKGGSGGGGMTFSAEDLIDD